MKSYRKIITVLLFVCFAFAPFVVAQTNSGIGYHAAPFLRVSPSARQVGIGEAFTALADDINLLRYNVAGLGNVNKIQFATNFHNWIDDTQQGSIGFALPRKYGVLGVEMSYFDEGELVEVDENFNATGAVLNSNDILLTVGWGSYLKLYDNNISAGASLKLLRQNLVGITKTNVGVDLGVQYRLDPVAFGLTIQNIGLSKVSFDQEKASLPTTVRLGAAGRLPLSDLMQLNIATDMAWTSKQKMRYYLGGELLLNDLFFVRTGFQLHETAVSPWAGGFGLNMPMTWLAGSKTRLDYAYSPIETFDTSTHRFSLLFTFGEEEDMSDKLRAELEAARRARKRVEALEDELAKRLANIKDIAAQSEGKIEVEEKANNEIKVTLRSVNFEFDKADLRPEDEPTMQQLGDILNTYPDAKVHVAGYTDSIGTDIYNFRLSQRRIKSVMNFLSDKADVNASRFFMPVGYGELYPSTDNGTEEGRFANRRVEFVLNPAGNDPVLPKGSAILNVKVIDNNTIQVTCNGAVEPGKLKTLTNPNRLLFDIPNVYIDSDLVNYTINRGAIKQVRLGFHPDERYTRVVFDLTKSVNGSITVSGSSVIVKVIE